MTEPTKHPTLSKRLNWSMLLALSFSFVSCSSKEPIKQPLTRVENPTAVQTMPDAGPDKEAAKDVHADAQKKDVSTTLGSWSRMVPIDPVLVSKGVVLVDTIRAALNDCAGVVSDHGIHKAGKPNRKLARKIKKKCRSLRTINQDDVLSGAGTSPFLDSLLLNTAALIAETQHLREILSGKIKIPETAFNREIEARVSGCTRHISDVQRALEPTRQQLEAANYDEAELAGLLGLLDQPMTLIDTVAKMVDIRIISPIWSALMTDVRQNILKGRPAAQLRDKLMLRIVRHRLGRIVSRVEALVREDGELAHGFDLYLSGVQTYINRMEALADSLTTTKDYEERATLLQQLQRIPRDERKTIRDAKEFWKQNYTDATSKPAKPKDTP